MKKRGYTYVALLIAIVICSSTVLRVQSKCDSPVVGDHSGAPGETSCTGCHAGTTNSGNGILEFHVGNDSTYIPGHTYTCNVRLIQADINKFGFVNLALKNSDNTTIGSFGLVDSIKTRKYTLGGRNYISHTPCSADADTIGKMSWTYTWQAPIYNVGSITLYISGLAANHNHTTLGDFTYTKTIQLKPATSTGLTDNGIDNTIDVFPNPSNNDIFIKGLSQIKGEKSVEITDMSGRLISISNHILGSEDSKVIGLCKPGLYSLKIRTEYGEINRKIIFQ